MKKKNKKAFTIVELVISIVVLAVLAGITVTTFTSVSEETRDNTRYGNAITISEALEKYYERNGGYPSVASIANSSAGNTGEAVASKLSIPADSLIMPKMPDSSTNAISSDPQPSNDYIAYVAQSAENNDSCQNDINGTCDQYILRYVEESGETKVIESRRTPMEIAEKPDLNVAASSASTVNASWTTVTGATSYTLQRSLSSSMDSATASSHGSPSATVSGLSANVTYYFRVQANLPSGTSEWSDVKSVTTNGVTAPTGTLTISASMSGTNAVGTAGGGTCASGTTIERQIRYSENGGGYTSYTTGSVRNVAATEGHQYTFQQQARCVGTGANSGWVTSSTASVVRPINTPSAPGLSASTSGSTTTWTATNTCPSGTTATYERQSLQQGGAWTSWEGTSTSNTSTWNTSAQGYTYSRVYHIKCGNSYTTSAWSAQSSTVSYTRPIAVTQATGWSHTVLGWQNEANCKYYSGCKWRRFNWTPPTCPAGTTYYSSAWNSYVGPLSAWDNGQGQAYRWWYGYSTTSTTSDSVAYSSAVNSHIVEYQENVPVNYDDVMHKLIWTCRNSTTGATGTSTTYSPIFRYE